MKGDLRKVCIFNYRYNFKFFNLCSDKHNHVDWFLTPGRVMDQILVQSNKKFASDFFLVQIKNKRKSRAFRSHNTGIKTVYDSSWALVMTTNINGIP